MNDEIEYYLKEIAENLGKIVEQLEIINSPEKEKEFNKWYYFWSKEVKNTKELIVLYTESNKPEKVKYYTQELENLQKENFKG